MVTLISNVPFKLHDATTSRSFTLGTRLLVTLVGTVAVGARALWVLAFIYLGIGIAKLDGNVTLEFVLEANRLQKDHDTDSILW